VQGRVHLAGSPFLLGGYVFPGGLEKFEDLFFSQPVSIDLTGYVEKKNDLVRAPGTSSF
jgi:hypothetical protein